MKFDLWLEFEHWEQEQGDDPEDEFFNMLITLSNGKDYALNVWTYQALPRFIQDDQVTGENMHGAYMLAPDLFVERLDRALLEQIVAHLIANEALKPEWEVPEDDDNHH